MEILVIFVLISMVVCFVALVSRWKAGVLLLLIAIPTCTASLLADPYTSMGTTPEYLRPSVADFSFALAVPSALLAAVAALSLYSDKERPQGWKTASIFAACLLLFSISVARIVWLKFVVSS